jgi:transposase
VKKVITKGSKGKAPVISRKDRVYVGLDVHKRSIYAAVRINGVEHNTAVLPPQSKAVIAFLAPYHLGLQKVVYEAGPTGFALARALKNAKMKIAVVPPSKIPRPAVRGAKSDKIDCRMLAEFAEKDLLKEVAIPTVEEESDRDIQRLRDSLVDRRRKAKQRIRSFLLLHNLPEPANLHSNWSLASIKGLQIMPMNPQQRFCMEMMLEDLMHILDQVDRVKAKLREMASEERYAMAARRLRTHPGVGETTSMQVLTEIFQPDRFDNQRQVAAYVGLAPLISSSGESRTEGPLMRGGRGALRCTLLEAAWVWIRQEKRADKLYKRLVRNTGSAQKAIVAMARRMLVNLWFMLVRKQEYRPFAA